ncbi:type IA DNA topoisomerase [Muribaculaceae bacterium Isolate-113 (HZI)]|nr:type IA DNA topoisomerase [Muribaculaceae bacterium Isolate-114 (HZI)]ROT18434.1 type IA DNA topoisomerase [Muribaculaceae bacterium Isolate-113 (HZI)]
MITIIAQNKISALAIARATANDNEGNRHFYGSKYFITWMTPKMIEITTPRGLASYWFRDQSFPHLPKYLTLSITTRSGKDGEPMTPEANAQLDIIKSLLAKSESIIVATDPTQEGELSFRYLYSYLHCTLPYSRAIINDLTIKGVNRAISYTMPAERYDKWYNAARLRDEADWLVGVNARRALAFAAGRGTYRIGRTSASVLKMIADRNIMVKSAEQTTERHTTVAVKDRNGNIFALHSIEPNCVTANATSEVKIISVEKNESKVRTPKLYNLINLQIDAARLFGMTPLRTYEAALRLFGRKLISYPVAAGSTVPQRKYQECRKVLEKMLSYSNYASVAMANLGFAPGRGVDKSNFGTHGIVATGVPPLVLDDDMSRIYHLIVRRMYQTFSKDAVVIRSRIIAECEGVRYQWSGESYKTKGWHTLFPDTLMDTQPVPAFTANEEVSLFSAGSYTSKTSMPEDYTDATLIEDLLAIRGTINADGIAKDIVHLESSGLIERDAWGHISITTKGRLLYGIVREMKIADICEVIKMDNLMKEVTRDKISASAYDTQIKQITRDVTAEILASAKLYPRMEEDIPCPHCSEGVMKTFGRVAMCDNPECGHYVFRQFYGVTLSHSELASLINTGSTPPIAGFRARSGKTFKAQVIINAAGNTQVVSKNKSENA